MVKYVIKRILLSILILFGVSLILFGLVRMLPPTILYEKLQSMSIAGADADKLFEDLSAQYGLNTGFFEGYWTWLTSFLKGDFGVSWSNGASMQI